MRKAATLSILSVMVLLAVTVIAEAQQPKKVPPIGFVSARADPTPTTPDSSADALRQGLRDLGYIALLIRYRKQIADLVIKNRLPSMWEGSNFVEAGGLMSYSDNYAETYRRAAVYVDKILKGSKPDDLPVEQPTKF